MMEIIDKEKTLTDQHIRLAKRTIKSHLKKSAKRESSPMQMIKKVIIKIRCKHTRAENDGF